jgi:hypothetical protein
MSYLLEREKVKKFFEILKRLDRTTSKIYEKYTCQKQVFVRRTINKWFKNLYIVLYTPSEQTDVQYRQYISINNIEYYLGWQDELTIYYYDYIKPCNIYNEMKLDYNKCMKLEGEFTNGDNHKLLLSLTLLSIPNRTFTFKAYNKKNYKETVWETKARTYYEAYNNVKEYKGDLYISELIED